MIMKIFFRSFCAFFLFAIVACVEDNEQRNLTRKYEVAEVRTTLYVDIPCRLPWSLTGTTDWCHTATTGGRFATSLPVTVEANTGDRERVCELLAISDDVRCAITITQSAAENIVLPVVFHVFYSDAEDSLQYVDASRIASILDKVNAYYAGENGGQNMNLQFSLATHNPYGAPLDPPGVEYVKQDVPAMDCNEFMTDNTGKYTPYLWEPNEYINVMLYNFVPSADSDSEILGISHLPYTPESNYLEGTNSTTYPYLTLENLQYPYSVSINSRYFYEDGSPEQYDPDNISCTLAHELGHYLGLLHVFSDNDNAETCADTDYCADTYSYNYADYLGYVGYAVQNYRGEQLYNALYQRTSCGGEIYFSDNIMDYHWVTNYHFTSDQRTRVRHVLHNSPLLPTSRNAVVLRSDVGMAGGKIDLPIMCIE